MTRPKEILKRIKKTYVNTILLFKNHKDILKIKNFSIILIRILYYHDSTKYDDDDDLSTAIKCIKAYYGITLELLDIKLKMKETHDKLQSRYCDIKLLA